MLILGLNAWHADSAACIMKDGCLVAAAEEERFRRIKHWAGLPTQAIDFCLREAGAALGDVDHIAINRKPGANNWRRLGFVLTHVPDPRLMWQKIQNIRSASSAAEALEKAYGVSLKAQIHHVEHTWPTSLPPFCFPALTKRPASRSMASATSPAPR